MEYIVTSSEMQNIDATTIQQIGIPGMVLMEKAALKMFQIMCARFDQTKKICIVAGCGNNGGDGLVLGRMLIEEGYDVDIQVVGNVAHCSDQFAQQMEILKNLEIPVMEEADYSKYDILVDAIFGVGLSRDVKGHYADVIQAMEESSAYKVAVDAPSGICCTTGRVLGIALHCDLTITFGLNKRGLILYPGSDYAGEVIVTNIGFPKKVIDCLTPSACTYNEEDLSRLPVRRNDSNKGTYGKVLVVAGAKNMAGACYFSAKAAYLCGAGLVQIFTHESNRTILQTLLPEAVMTTYEDDDQALSILKDIKDQSKSAVIGPGLGVNDLTRKMLSLMLSDYKGSLVIDADACNVLGEMTDELSRANASIAITPHMKEASRILGQSIPEIADNRFEVAETFAQEYGVAFVLKDARTVVAGRDGITYINCTGNHGMSTGGSGDVLTGIIAGFAAGGLDIMEAARMGVFIHGRSGDQAARVKGERSLMASDILEGIDESLKE